MKPLSPDTSYNISNHANGFENVFSEIDKLLKTFDGREDFFKPHRLVID